jgi:hypothetical protein
MIGYLKEMIIVPSPSALGVGVDGLGTIIPEFPHKSSNQLHLVNCIAT